MGVPDEVKAQWSEQTLSEERLGMAAEREEKVETALSFLVGVRMWLAQLKEPRSCLLGLGPPESLETLLQPGNMFLNFPWTALTVRFLPVHRGAERQQQSCIVQFWGFYSLKHLAAASLTCVASKGHSTHLLHVNGLSASLLSSILSPSPPQQLWFPVSSDRSDHFSSDLTQSAELLLLTGCLFFLLAPHRLNCKSNPS
ncbi:unnamed protein product [Pleuronectes platessa]|uniref:Uncharacterized protein n=1 Tax=Pleuronectes platessa TaxID=8262 RepID=A0A9N7VY84_PLEPL|nr:unnamed protein product [Pleuronectes platessa]